MSLSRAPREFKIHQRPFSVNRLLLTERLRLSSYICDEQDLLAAIIVSVTAPVLGRGEVAVVGVNNQKRGKELLLGTNSTRLHNTYMQYCMQSVSRCLSVYTYISACVFVFPNTQTFRLSPCWLVRQPCGWHTPKDRVTLAPNNIKKYIYIRLKKTNHKKTTPVLHTMKI